MKRKAPFLLLLTALSIVSGYLLSSATLIGRTGLHVFYKEYRFLKTWYKGAAAVLAVWVILFLIHNFVQRQVSAAKARWIHAGALLLAVIGLYFTYSEFRNDLSYRLMGERFHLGAYLFWIGWMLIALFHLWPQKQHITATNHNNKALE